MFEIQKDNKANLRDMGFVFYEIQNYETPFLILDENEHFFLLKEIGIGSRWALVKKGSHKIHSVLLVIEPWIEGYVQRKYSSIEADMRVNDMTTEEQESVRILIEKNRHKECLNTEQTIRKMIAKKGYYLTECYILSSMIKIEWMNSYIAIGHEIIGRSNFTRVYKLEDGQWWELGNIDYKLTGPDNDIPVYINSITNSEEKNKSDAINIILDNTRDKFSGHENIAIKADITELHKNIDYFLPDRFK